VETHQMKLSKLFWDAVISIGLFVCIHKFSMLSNVPKNRRTFVV